jgi:hypothetical protein
MKYIKLFEDFWNKITEEEYIKSINYENDSYEWIMNNHSDFNKDEIDTIKDIIGDEYRISKVIRAHGDNPLPKSTIYIYKGDVNQYTIIKIRDEWYYVLKEWDPISNEDTYYKCDQFEALIKYLKNEFKND